MGFDEYATIIFTRSSARRVKSSQGF
jgi:hypothetical protein